MRMCVILRHWIWTQVGGDEEVGKELCLKGKRSTGCSDPVPKATMLDWAQKGNGDAQQYCLFKKWLGDAKAKGQAELALTQTAKGPR